MHTFNLLQGASQPQSASRPSQPISKQDAARVIVLLALDEAIKDLCGASPLKGVPSGELYAHMSGFVTLGTYQGLINELEETGRITSKNHLISHVEVR